MWPEIPADISSLSVDELAALANTIRDTAVAVLADAASTPEQRTEAGEFVAQRKLIAAAHAEKVAALAAEEAAAAALAALAAEADLEGAPVVEEPKVLATVGATAAVVNEPAPQTSLSVPTTPAVPGNRPLAAIDYLQATDSSGKELGTTFESWAELAAAAVAKSADIDPGTTNKYKLASIRGNYGPERTLGDDIMLNAAKFEQTDELMAAWCPPATPYYNVACANTLRRPVFNSLPGFAAPRGRVSIMPSPDLADITSGFGQWTIEDDADANARKNCITVTCGSPTTYEMYGVWRCMTVKNLLAMTYPELVEAWLNRLGAAQARLGETLLLDAMGSECVSLDAPALGYGAAVTITSTILNYLALYQETQRWDITGNMEAWAPRWVLWGMKMDIMRRRRTDGNVVVPSDSEIETMFRNVGLNVHWFIDTPTWAVAIPGVGAATLNLIPQSVQILIAPPGKFALIDRGNLNIGVTGDNMYRDNDSNSKNQFTWFFESFEGVVNTTTCPAHILDIPVCWNGAMTADINVNCQGGDEVGYQS